MPISPYSPDTENKALVYAAVSVQDWADNALTNRARIAKDEIISSSHTVTLTASLSPQARTRGHTS